MTPTDSVRPIYPAIDDYAVIGDCRTAALVNSRGAIDWLCLPDFSSPAVFAALLDAREGGSFSIRPLGEFRVERRYIGNTPVLQTDFQTDRGVVRLTDLMPVKPNERHASLLYPQRELLRCIQVLAGEVEIETRYAPRPRYGKCRPRLHHCGHVGWSCTDHDALFLLNTDFALELGEDATELRGRVRLRRGETRHFSLSFVAGDVGVAMPLGNSVARLNETIDWWNEWASRCCYEGPYRNAVLRSAVTLKLLTHHLSGAVVAAPTTSLPEWIGGNRNWDYRYCWPRDASLTLCAFMDLGFESEGDAYLGWLLHATRLTHPRLQILYGIYGETELPEQTVDHLEGYRGSSPVRVGNAATAQLQLDVYGSVVLTAFDFVERGGALDTTEQRYLAKLGETVCKLWRLPDHGIWEIRGEPRHYTYSKLMCWVALDRLIKLQERNQLRTDRDRFAKERDAIEQEIEARAFSETLGGYAAYYGAAIPDASLLLMARYGYKAAHDPKMRGTFHCIERQLARGPLLYRLPLGVDNMDSPEGAFLIASFWAIDYLVQCGDIAKARRRFDELLAVANDVGLYAEEVDPASGAALGNFPQAFSHVGLITAALGLAEAQQTTRRAVAQ